MRTLIFLFCCLWSRAAFADDATGVVVTGDASLQPKVLAHFEDWLRTNGHELLPSPLPADAIKSIVACFDREDESCARGVIDAQARSPIVVFARVDVTAGANDAHDVSITGYLFAKGHDPIADRRFCERCNDDSLAQAAAALVSALTGAANGATGTLRLTTAPPGAKVVIDGNAIGVTPLEHALAAGDHEVTFVMDGHEYETRNALIHGGETTTLDVSLTETRAPRRSRAVPAALTIVGLAGVGVGIALIAIDQDPSPQGPLEIRNTAPLGVTLTAVGGAALVASVWLWLHRSPDRAPVASASNDGGFIGWSQTF